jgi:hypothetical protein
LRKSLKAALFSAFIFPGSGHFLLKKHIQGALLAGLGILCTYALLSTAVEIAQNISAKILSGEIFPDITTLTEEISRQIAASDTLLADISTYLLAACWLVGIVDSYRVGRLQDKANCSETEKT